MPSAELSSQSPVQNPSTAPDDPTGVCVRSIHIMADGDLADFQAVIHPDAANREAASEPTASRGRGPAAFHATSLWLRSAFSDLRWVIHQVAADGDVVAVHATMSGRHTGPFVRYDAAGRASQVMPPTGKTFATTQTHWFRLADGKVIEHWANRDDLALAQQAGWIPPSPRYLMRMAIARWRARDSSRARAAG